MSETRRLFIGLMADVEVQRKLQDYQARWIWPRGARLTRPENFHLTLQFLGEASDETADRLLVALAELRLAGVQRELGLPGSFHQGVAILNPHENADLRRLHSVVRAVVVGAGVSAEQRAFHPHVTMARDAGAAVAPGPASIVWATHPPILVWSRPQGTYQVLSAVGDKSF